MQKVGAYIFDFSPKKLATYLVLYPLVSFLACTIITITFKTISQKEAASEILVAVFGGILFVFIDVIVLLSIFWLLSAWFMRYKK
jgi:hypothetical protein